MTDTKQPEALRLVEQYDYGDPVAHSNTSAGEYPPLPEHAALIMRGKPLHRNWIRHVDTPVFTADQMRTYADATCAMRAQAAHAAAAWPEPADEDDHKRIRILRRGLNKSTVLAELLRHGTDAARSQAKEGGAA